MKKIYKTPVLHTIELNTEELIAQSIGLASIEDEADPEVEVDVKEEKSSLDNLWDDLW